MKVFVYEHITAGGFVEQPLPAALADEGVAMLRALVSDLSDVSGIRVISMRDPRMLSVPLTEHEETVASRAQWDATFARALESADAAWITAPESDGALWQLSKRVIDAKRRLVGSDLEAIALATSKWETAKRLSASDVAVVPAFRAHEFAEVRADRWVTKPDDGCGCVDTHVHSSETGARAWLHAQTSPASWVLQPFIPGDAFSLSVCADRSDATVISVNRQRIAIQGNQIHFRGVDLNVQARTDPQLMQLARQVHRAIPGLRGYFGIDLILNEGSWQVVEVNPRLTTSYGGLSASVGYNVAERIVHAVLCETGFAPESAAASQHAAITAS